MCSRASSRRRLAADVEALARRIGADHQKALAGLDPAMSDAGRQNDRVARYDARLAPVRPAQHEVRPAGGEPQRFVRRRIVVMEGIDTVAPLRRPSVLLEDGFEQILCGDGRFESL